MKIKLLKRLRDLAESEFRGYTIEQELGRITITRVTYQGSEHWTRHLVGSEIKKHGKRFLSMDDYDFPVLKRCHLFRVMWSAKKEEFRKRYSKYARMSTNAND